MNVPHRRQVRAISGWATTAMLSAAGCALALLLTAFVPLVDAWAVRRPGTDVTPVRAAAWVLLAVTFGLASTAFLIWLARARANLVAFAGGRPVVSNRAAGWFVPGANLVLVGLAVAEVAAGSVGRRSRLRRRMVALAWSWWGCLLAAGLVLLGGALAGLDNVQEIDDLRGRAAAGEPVDVSLAVHLLGRQMSLRLPAAALAVGAAVLVLLLIARTTSAQYGRVAKLRGAPALQVIAALRLPADEWTVEVPATLPTPSTPVGGTIRA